MTPKKLAVIAVVAAVVGIGLGLIASQREPETQEAQALGDSGFIQTEQGETGGERDIVVVQPSTSEQDEPELPQPSDAPEPEDPEDTDADDDGVANESDNCVNTPNADQADFDGDLKGDVCDADDDNDNLSDAAESGYGTNPYKKDTDGDGFWDGTEVSKGTNPLDKNSHPPYVFPDPGKIKN